MTWKVLVGDNLSIMRGMADNSVDAIVQDPPSGIGFMGLAWDKFGKKGMKAETIARQAEEDGQGTRYGRSGKPAQAEPGEREAFVAFMEERLREQLRILKPGGHSLTWALPRTAHWTAWAIENAGFVIRDTLAHMFGCLSSDAEVLVDGRWEHWQKATAGRLALCYDAEHDNFRWAPIQELVHYEHDEMAYRVHGGGTDHLVTADHRCLVWHNGGWRFVSAAACALEQQVRIPALQDVHGLLGALSVSVAIPEQSSPQAVRGARFTVADLARVTPEHYAGTVWCLRVPTGAFVVRCNGMAFVTGNSGFPKSRNIAKAIQKADGVQPIAILPATLGMANNPDWNALEHRHVMPAPEGEAAEWIGWGTALKPGREDWILAQKPISESTIAKNVQRWGTGAINIDGCRIGTDAGWSYPNGPRGNREQAILSGLAPRTEPIKATGGRWPANVVLSHVDGVCRQVGTRLVPTGTAVQRNLPLEGGQLGVVAFKPGTQRGPDVTFGDENGLETVEAWDCAPDCAVRILDEQSGELAAGAAATRGQSTFSGLAELAERVREEFNPGFASRFFYTAKPARSEKEAGLAFAPVIDDPAQVGLFALPDEPARVAGTDSQGLDTRGRALVNEDGTPTLAARFVAKERAMDHPTTKPTDLMRYFVRLITPPGGTVLDAFAGSGTTGVGAVLEGFDVVLIEREPKYAEYCRARCRWAENPHGGA